MREDQVRVTVQVRVPPSVAFAVFTEQTDTWWLRGPAYRVGGRSPGTLRFEGGAGGRLVESFETAAGERAHVAGTILDWEPPTRLRFEWRGVNFAAHERTEVEIRFEPTASGTRVTLEHRGFAALRPDHPVRHGQPPAAFLADLGRWWGALLSSLRERATRERDERR
ncbi:MAG: SRPBCC domain-containing protein [Myxococcota bacterium]